MQLDTTRVGFLCLAGGGSSDCDRTRRLADTSQKYMQKQESFEVIAPEGLITCPAEAAAAALMLREARIDALVVQIGASCPDSLTLDIVGPLSVPVALWAVPEPPFDDPKPWCGSTAGLLMHASALTACDHRFGVIIGDPEGEETRKALDGFLMAAAVRRTLRSCRIGMIGTRAPGFYAAGFDPLAVKDVFGPTISSVPSALVAERYEQISQAQAEEHIAELTSAGWANEVEDDELLVQCTRSALAMRMIREELQLDAISLPGPCADPPASETGADLANVLLSADGVIANTGGDVNGLLTMLLQHLLTGREVMSAEWVEMDERNNQVLFRNPGGAPRELIDPRRNPALRRISSGLDRVAVEVPMKTGQISIARLIFTQGNYKLLVARGRAVEVEHPLRGACVSVKFDYDVLSLFRTIIEHGFPHTYSLVYQNITAELLALADMLDIGVIAV